MPELDRIRALLDKSRDPDPPPATDLLELLERLGTVAVVGLSRDPAKAARRVPSYLAANGIEIVPVNPYADRILGRTAHARLEEVEEPVDLVLVFRPSEEAGDVVRAAMGRPERPAIWLQEGILAPEAVREARDLGLLVVQDLCIFKAHRELGARSPR